MHCQLPSPPPQKHHPFFLAKPSFKSGNCPIPPFILVFQGHPPPPPDSPPPDSPPLKFGFFSELQKYKNFSSLAPSYLLKVSKFLFKISQFQFLVMTEKHSCLVFLSLNISDLIFCVCENCAPPPPPPSLKKATPS